MKVLRPLALALSLAGLAAAQTSPPPLCFEFNPLPPSTTSLLSVNTSYLAPLVVHFTAPATTTVDRVDLWFPFWFGGYQAFQLELYATTALGVPPPGPYVVAFTSPNFVPSFWHAFEVPSGVASPTLTAGSTWALGIRGLPLVANQSQYAGVCEAVYYDPAATAPLPYQLGSTAACPAQLPPSGAIGIPIRFRGTACGPGPPASVGPLGVSCGHSSGQTISSLAATTPPVLGSSWSLICYGPAGATAHLFWSGGVNPAGSLIVPGSSCLHYLDETSLLSLLSQGAEPIVIATLPSTPPSTVTWTFQLPSFPFYAGLVIGAQAIVVSATGTIPLGGGVFVQTTNALQIVLGY